MSNAKRKLINQIKIEYRRMDLHIRANSKETTGVWIGDCSEDASRITIEFELELDKRYLIKPEDALAIAREAEGQDDMFDAMYAKSL